MARGVLRIYLGAAPGVGKTYAMLDEARRRSQRGTDVVVGSVDTHGRPFTNSQLAGLEMLDQSSPLELSAEKILSRAPQLVVIDELAGFVAATPANGRPDSPAVPRYRVVERILDAGIDVLATIDIGSIESLGEIVSDITGLSRTSFVPDRFVRSADQLHLVDETPEALRRRLAHGNIYHPHQVGADIASAFQAERLSALRKLTFSWMANRVDEQFERPHGQRLDPAWETREIVLVALTGAPSSEHVIRRAARIAERQRARLIGLHVRSVDQPGSSTPDEPLPDIEEQRRLIGALGGEYREVASGDITAAIIEHAESEGATQIVVGAPKRNRWIQFSRGSLISELLEKSPIDVHVVSSNRRPDSNETRSAAGSPTGPAIFSPRRRQLAWVVAILGPIILTGALALFDDTLDVAAQLLVMVLGVTAAAIVGGARPAGFAASEAFLLSNWFFIAPRHDLSISNSEDAVSLAVFVVVALVVGRFVSKSAMRSADSLRVRSDASTLAAMAGTVASSDDPLPVLIERLRAVYDAAGASLFVSTTDSWALVASAGPGAPANQRDADQILQVGEDCQLLLAGGPFRAVDRSTSTAFLDQLAVAVEQRALRAARVEAESTAATNELRAALLAAVSHDLRTPLATVKVAVSTLRQPTVQWPEAVRDELLCTIEQSTDRLIGLITNLLEMSRLQAEAVDLQMTRLLLDEVVSRSALDLPAGDVDVRFELDDRLPSIDADPALLGHILSNLIDNATKWSPPGGTVVVDARAIGDDVHLRVIDQGPGIPPEIRDHVLRAFQRNDSTGTVEGTGLGLAIADGFARLMGFTLVLDDTPGGGTTATVIIPVPDSSHE